MNAPSKTRTQNIVNYADLSLQTLWLPVVIFFLSNMPEIQMGQGINAPKVNNLFDLIEKVMVEGSLGIFFTLLNSMMALFIMILPLLVWWVYQIITAVLLGAIFRRRYLLIYGLLLAAIAAILLFIAPNTLPKLMVNAVIAGFFGLPFLYYFYRVYDTFWVK
ncbi:MAG: hypothetical protein MUE85_10350 [Microscillaceae bacterium]|jgi:hypothetical protein|nr:hypothetical protein [Microscillaceae bacterium]